MDQKRIVFGVDLRYTRMMPLEVKVGRSDDALEILEWRVRRRAGRAERDPLRLLVRRALADLAREASLNFGRIRGRGRLGVGFAG